MVLVCPELVDKMTCFLVIEHSLLSVSHRGYSSILPPKLVVHFDMLQY